MLHSKLGKRLFLLFIPGIFIALAMGPFYHSPAIPVPSALSFTKKIIHPEFISEGVATGDVNQDGQKDILSGPYWFEAPNWERHEIREPKTFDYTKEWSDSFLNFATDVNMDGWVDFIRIDFPGKGAYWYENPQNTAGHWKEYLIDSSACNESPMLADVDDDGRMDLVFGNEKSMQMFWFKPTGSGKTVSWSKIPISKEQSPGTKRFSHGLGLGDINGDGRKDIIIRQGWWEAPSDRQQVPWTFHEANLGEPCSQMYAYDLDGDGDQEVLSASAHNFGIWWHEQRTENGQITFRTHLIDSSFSQTHGVAFTDLNKDGLPDFITGKRFFAHNGKDPGGLEAAVLYWFEFRPGEDGAPEWIPHLIDQDSGVGLQVVIDDLNQDGKEDIINANKKGVICFFQQ